MRSLLLDTHVLLWVLTDPGRLPPRTLERVRDPATRLLVSAASAWEVATKHRLGRLPEADAIVEAYPEHLVRLGAEELAITGRHALAAGRLGWEHRDPFDRILVAQAMLESVPIVTADAAIREFPAVRTMW